jgi:PAS domain S-box-containing protein
MTKKMNENGPNNKENHDLQQFNDVLNLQPISADDSLEAHRVQNASRYRILLENLGVAVVVHATDTSIIMSNPRASELLGLSMEQMAGKVAIDPNWNFVDSELTPIDFEDYPVNRVLNTKASFRDQIFGIRRSESDEIVWALVNGMPVINRESLIDEVIISFIDISERVQAERELKAIIHENKIVQEKLQTEALYSRNLLETSQDLLVTINLEGKLMDVNTAAERVTGVCRQELIGTFFSNYFTDFEKAQEAFEFACVQESVTGYQLAIKNVSGKITEVLYNASVFRDENGMIIGVFAAARDISSLKQVENELNLLNIELEQRVLARTKELEMAFQQLLKQSKARAKLSNELTCTNIELALQIEDKAKRSAELEIANQELEFQNEEKEKRMAELIYLNNELDTFSYSVAHDLRGPLRHMEGFVDLLKSKFYDILPSKAKHYLDCIADSSSKMGLLIDDLLQFSRSGKQEVHHVLFDMNELVQEILTSIKSDIQNRSIEWKVSVLPHVIGDKSLLYLVWKNLLDNAVKFSGKVINPSIQIDVCVVGEEYIFSVSDNGVGFDMKYADKLFGVFQRLHPIGEFEGIGIGLANVRRIILKHRGRTWAEAEVGKGAVFYFSLPILREDKP